MKQSSNVKPCSAEDNIFFSALNFINPCVYKPLDKFKVIITEKIACHELNTLYFPYSAVVNNRVKIGVDIIEIPFEKKPLIKNQNEALTCIGNDLYLSISLFKLKFLSFIFL